MDPETGTEPTKADTSSEAADSLNGIWQRQAKRIARNPCKYLWASLAISIAISYVGLVIGEFEVSANSGGWQSRGTLIADRQTQLMLVLWNKDALFHGGTDAWEELLNNVQPGWEDDDDGDDGSRRLATRSSSAHPVPYTAETWLDYLQPKADMIKPYNQEERRQLPFLMTKGMTRRLQEQSDVLEGCDFDWYTSANLTDPHQLWPVWRTKKAGVSALSPEVIHDMCIAEENTLKILEEKNLCYGCDGGCLPPYSIVFYARLLVPNGMMMSCETLSEAWAPFQETVEKEWKTCVQDIKATHSPDNPDQLPESCPFGFNPALVDAKFDETEIMVYTSSIFPTTSEHVYDLYEILDDFDTGSSLVEASYDTAYDDFLGLYLDDSLTRDMSLAMGSAIVVALAIMIHTRSGLITLIGLLQIVFSFPLAYFVYKLVAGLDFFPFLNFIGVFVVFALGADDVFVAVDKWKNARLDNPKATTEHIAAMALPDAAGAMFLTTSTTAVAFFATAICPVAPVKMFAIFLGLLVVFDYIMNVLLVFPALCIYDRRNQNGQGGCCCSCFGCLRQTPQEDNDETIRAQVQEEDQEDETKSSLIRRILSGYYWLLHKGRWGLLLACAVGLVLCVIFAAKLEMPTSSDVELVPEDDPRAFAYLWRKELLDYSLDKAAGSEAFVVWGAKPADTGVHGDPNTFSQLVLDNSFEPSSEDAQVYLAGFCDSLFQEEFARLPETNYTCPMNRFDTWLQDQSNADEQDPIYANHCDGATGIPIPQAHFDSCIIAWSQQVEETSVLSHNGKVEILYFPFGSRVRYDDHYDVLDEEWNLIEDWMQEQNKAAPVGVRNAFFSSDDFWWYDTNGQMLNSAYSSAGIALAAAAAVILLSSHSIVLTLFATISIGYVLSSVTATLVALGWTLGFLEAICFAILIGVSVDFVIHFCHAYAALPGKASREERTKHALILMGPSVLAAAFTTISSATIMLFTVITFFQKFALILFFTVIQATIGSFVVFLTLSVCLGPTEPTKFIDALLSRCSGSQDKESDDDDKDSDLGHTDRADTERGEVTIW